MTMGVTEQIPKVATRAKLRKAVLTGDNIPLGFILLCFALLLVVPLLLIFVISFWPTLEHRAVPGFTLSNYGKLFGTSMYVRILFKTLWLSALSSIICVLIGYPFAYFVAKKVTKYKFLVLCLIIIPFWTSFLIRVYAGMIILGRTGLVNSALLNLGIIKEPLEFLLYTTFSMVLGFIYIYAPFSILTIYSTIIGIDDRILDAAFDLGANWWQRLRYVTLPLSLPGVVAGFLLVFMPIMGDYVIPLLIGGPEGTVLTTLMITQFGFSSQWGFGSVLALLLMILTAIVVWLAGRYVNLGRLFG